MPELPSEAPASKPRTGSAQSRTPNAPLPQAFGGGERPAPLSVAAATRDAVSVVGNGNTDNMGGHHVHHPRTTPATTPYQKAVGLGTSTA